jgi:hypothetical protein
VFVPGGLRQVSVAVLRPVATPYLQDWLPAWAQHQREVRRNGLLLTLVWAGGLLLSSLSTLLMNLTRSQNPGVFSALSYVIPFVVQAAVVTTTAVRARVVRLNVLATARVFLSRMVGREGCHPVPTAISARRPRALVHALQRIGRCVAWAAVSVPCMAAFTNLFSTRKRASRR